MKTNQTVSKDPGCCEPGNACCGNLEGLGCC